MSQEDKPVAEVLSTQVEAWQREVSALQEKIAFAIGKPVAAQEPETESFVQTVPDHCDRIVWKGTYIHLPIANAAPCARCKELEQINAKQSESIEFALYSDKRIKELQAKITEQAAEIARINRIASCGSVDSWMSLSDDDKRKWFAVTLDVDQKKADRIKALEAAVERQSKVIELCEEGLRQWHVPKNRYVALEAINELEKGVG